MVDAAPAIYHLCRRDEWRAAVAEGEYPGSSQDAADGFIHFSSHDQVAASAAKHRAGQDGLVLLCVDPELLGEALKWEASTRGADGGTPDRDKITRGADGGTPDRDKITSGVLFPHLYGPLPVNAVTEVHDLPLGPDGRHRFPSGFPASPGDGDIPA